MRHVVVASLSILAYASPVLAADDMLEAAMKRIAELEAKNKALEQSNKEKDALLGKQDIKSNVETNRIKTHSIKTSAVPLTTSTPTTTHPDASTQNPLNGAYFGINGGYGGGDITSYTNLASQGGVFGSATTVSRIGGAIAGGQLGYNFIMPNHLVLGGETDFDWADISTQGGTSSRVYGAGNLGTSGSSSRTGINWIGTVRVKLGYQIESFMPFITGGLAYGMAAAQDQYNSSSTYSYSNFLQWHYANLSKISAGWSAGAGVEYAIDKNWSFKTEYLYSQIGSAPPNLTDLAYFSGSEPNVITGYGQNSPIGFHQVRAGLNFHPHFFDQPAPAVIAKY